MRTTYLARDSIKPLGMKHTRCKRSVAYCFMTPAPVHTCCKDGALADDIDVVSARGPKAGGGGGGGGGSSCQAVCTGCASSLKAARNPAVPPNADALLCTSHRETM